MLGIGSCGLISCIPSMYCRSYKGSSEYTVATYKIPYSRKNSNPMGKIIISIKTNKEIPPHCKISSQYFDCKSIYANYSTIMTFKKVYFSRKKNNL